MPVAVSWLQAVKVERVGWREGEVVRWWGGEREREVVAVI